MESIIELLDEPTRLEMLAEEATELAHAALKLARHERGENPTCKDEGELIKNLCEELGDVLLTAKKLPYRPSPDMMSKKNERWKKRLKNARAPKIDPLVDKHAYWVPTNFGHAMCTNCLTVQADVIYEDGDCALICGVCGAVMDGVKYASR